MFPRKLGAGTLFFIKLFCVTVVKVGFSFLTIWEVETMFTCSLKRISHVFLKDFLADKIMLGYM